MEPVYSTKKDLGFICTILDLNHPVLFFLFVLVEGQFIVVVFNVVTLRDQTKRVNVSLELWAGSALGHSRHT